jgi:nicotinamidase-related amidase
VTPQVGPGTRAADASGTALLVIDVQNGVVDAAHQRDAVVATIGDLVDRARSARVPVVWVQHSDDTLIGGTSSWAIVDELVPSADEVIVQKQFGDSFEQTDLNEKLALMGVGRLLITGAQTDACIRSTLHGAFVRGYDTVLVADAHTTEDLRPWGGPVAPEEAIAYTNLTWSWMRAPGRSAQVVAAADVDFVTEGP